MGRLRRPHRLELWIGGEKIFEIEIGRHMAQSVADMHRLSLRRYAERSGGDWQIFVCGIKSKMREEREPRHVPMQEWKDAMRNRKRPQIEQMLLDGYAISNIRRTLHVGGERVKAIARELEENSDFRYIKRV